MKKFLVLLGMITCLFSCSNDKGHPYRIVQMENGEYIIQYKAAPCFGWKNSVGWIDYTDASGSYRFENKLEVSEAYVKLVNEYIEQKRANTVKEIIK